MLANYGGDFVLANRLKRLREEKELLQRDIAKMLNISASAYGYYEQGKRDPDTTTLHRLAEIFGCTTDYLLGKSDYRDPLPPGAFPVGPQARIPVLGVIRAGVPILAEEHIEGYELIDADLAKTGEYFYLRVTGDSMTGARIHEGDLVLVRKQEDVENGEIAVVNVDGENATLKRVFKTNGTLILHPENPAHKPIMMEKGEVRIVGKVVEVKFKV